MKQTIITNSFQETQKLGADFARKINSISVIALYGNLGSGKTTFIQGFAKGLGIQNKIISPTFIIMRTYEFNPSQPPLIRGGVQISPPDKGADEGARLLDRGGESEGVSLQKKTFYHVDLYRIKDEKDIEGLGLTEIMNDTQNIVAIEWPEKIEKILPQKKIDIFFEYLNDNKRKITF